jgi:arylsulfatase A-like enzyme
MTLYRELIQVPLVMRLPGNYGAGSRPIASAQHIDLLPTILELAGGEVPAWAQGRSLLPAVDDPGWDSQELVRSYLRLDVVSAASLVVGDWHLLRTPMESEYARTRGLELFDLGNDPAQLSDVRAENPALAGWLLRRWRAAESEDIPLFAVGEVEIDEELAARLRDLGYIQ